MRKRTAFTLVELLVAIAIIALLVALLLPSMGKARAVSKRLGCLSSLRQIHVGYMSYISDNRGYLYTLDYNADFAAYGTPYRWDHTLLDRYYAGGATKAFKDGCPDRGRHIPPYAPDTWSYGANGAVHAYVSAPDIPYYNAKRPVKMEDFKRPSRTHLFADMVQAYKRYPNHGFFDEYLMARTNRHERQGIGAVYADGRANFELQTDPLDVYPHTTYNTRIWRAMWHYAYGSCRLVGNGCFWHAYDSK